MDERCDGKVDCEDVSDEQACKVFIAFPGYYKLLTPPPVGNDSKLMINVSLNIDDIITVDENNGFFKTKITMERKWINSRLTYLNLKRNPLKN